MADLACWDGVPLDMRKLLVLPPEVVHIVRRRREELSRLVREHQSHLDVCEELWNQWTIWARLEAVHFIFRKVCEKLVLEPVEVTIFVLGDDQDCTAEQERERVRAIDRVFDVPMNSLSDRMYGPARETELGTTWNVVLRRGEMETFRLAVDAMCVSRLLQLCDLHPPLLPESEVVQTSDLPWRESSKRMLYCLNAFRMLSWKQRDGVPTVKGRPAHFNRYSVWQDDGRQLGWRSGAGRELPRCVRSPCRHLFTFFL